MKKTSKLKHSKGGKYVKDDQIVDKFSEKDSYSKGKGYNRKNNKQKQKEPKINTSKTGAMDIFDVYAKNDSEFKLAAESLGSNSGEITITPHNYTVIHDIDTYPIFGKPVFGKSVLNNGNGRVGTFLARFKDQLQFAPEITPLVAQTMAANASYEIQNVTQLAPIFARKEVKVNPNGMRPINIVLGQPRLLGYANNSTHPLLGDRK